MSPDAAYGDSDTRQAFADAGRTLVARVPGRLMRKHFPKEDFHIDLEDRLGGGRLHLSGGKYYPENPALGDPDRLRGTNSPVEGLPVRRSRLWGVPAANPVHRRVIGVGTNGAVAPAGGAVTAGPGPAAE